MAVDLYLAYLRVAFHCCYYCAVVADRADELQRKCVKHVRGVWSAAEMSEINKSSKRKGGLPCAFLDWKLNLVKQNVTIIG
jgi:predicted small metal-binding protein